MKTKMRNQISVVNEILKEIPDSEVDFINDLLHLRDGFLYKAPEEKKLCFDLISDIIFNYLYKPPKHDWQFKVLSIFSTLPVNRIKEDFN